MRPTMELQRRGELDSAEILQRVSPVAWQRINAYGRYQFNDDLTPMNFELLRRKLSSGEVTRLYARPDR